MFATVIRKSKKKKIVCGFRASITSAGLTESKLGRVVSTLNVNLFDSFRLERGQNKNVCESDLKIVRLEIRVCIYYADEIVLWWLVFGGINFLKWYWCPSDVFEVITEFISVLIYVYIFTYIKQKIILATDTSETDNAINIFSEKNTCECDSIIRRD